MNKVRLEIKDSSDFESQLAEECFRHEFADSDEQAMLVCARYALQDEVVNLSCEGKENYQFGNNDKDKKLAIIKIFSYLREDCGFKVTVGQLMNGKPKDNQNTCGLCKVVAGLVFYVWPSSINDIHFKLIAPKDDKEYFSDELIINPFEPYYTGNLCRDLKFEFKELLERWSDGIVRECLISHTKSFLFKETKGPTCE